MIYYPSLNPVIFHAGPLTIYWYGLMYLFGFGLAWILLSYRARKTLFLTSTQLSDLIFYVALGAIVGGRCGYILFYDFSAWLTDPLLLFKIWQGGMSFHGGFLGACIALGCFKLKYKKSFFSVSDFIVPVVPLGLGAGRLGNFINQELWGRATNVPWGMVFPRADHLPRHPSQLYELSVEGIILFIILWIFSSKPRPTMAASGLFLFLYGIFRFTLEFFRQPDPQIGFLAWQWLTMGQLLSFPMMVVGAIFFIFANIHVKNKCRLD